MLSCQPLKILLISPYFPPEVGSAAHLFYELGQALRGRGHEVLVLTGQPIIICSPL